MEEKYEKAEDIRMFLSKLATIKPLGDYVSQEEFTKYITTNIEDLLPPFGEQLIVKTILTIFSQEVLNEGENQFYFIEMDEVFDDVDELSSDTSLEEETIIKEIEHEASIEE